MPPFADPHCLDLVALLPEGAAPRPLPALTAEATDSGLAHFGWAARDFEAATGLQYNVARRYDPTPGQWLSEDPLGFGPGDAHLEKW